MPDQFEPTRVHRLARMHERRMRERRATWQMLNAAYLTRFWEHVGLMDNDARWQKWNVNGTEVEVNKLWRGLMTYKASLYRRSNRVELGPDPVGDRGDPVVSGLVANGLWTEEGFAARMDRMVEMALLFPGAGAKVGVEEGSGPPMRRVWSRAFPWWELVLDWDVSDPADERFRGHRYWMPVEDAEAKWGLDKLQGQARADFLGDTGRPNGEGDSAPPLGKDDDGEFVEMMEFVNLRDSFKGRGGVTYKGRQEVYVLGQDRKEYEGPVHRGAMAFADADGVGLPHIEALIFMHEPPYPLRGVPPAERVLPQLREFNVLRSKLAELVRRNARKSLRRKGVIADDDVTKLFDGNDGQSIEVDDPNVPLSDVWYPLANQPIPAEIWGWIGMVDADYAGSWGQIAPAQGMATDRNKTAYANQIEQFWTETEIGYHGNALTTFSRRLVKLLLRATVHAMSSVADSETNALPPGRKLAPVGSVETGDAATLGEVVAAGVEGEVAPVTTADEGAASAVAEGAATAVVAVAGEVKYVAFTVRDADRKAHVVTREALDADFEVKFLEGARTPLTDAAVIQFLTTQAQQYFAWFDLVLKGGPMGILARAWMQAVADRMQLPPELHVAALEAKAKAQPAPVVEKQTAAAFADVAAGPAPAVAPGVDEGAASGTDAVTFALQTVAEAVEFLGVPAAVEAVKAAQAALAAGDADALVEAAGAALAALAPLAESPPEAAEAQAALDRAAQVLQGIVQAGAARPPSEEQPQPLD